MENALQWSAGTPVRVRIPRAEEVRGRSYGEVTSPETLDFATLKPAPGGLFCEQIFGPVNDWQCACGLYNGGVFVGQTCPSCKVVATESKVRRLRRGHLELAAPVCHPEYVHHPVHPLARWCGLEQQALEGLVYYTHYRVFSLDTAEIRRNRDRWHQALQATEEYPEILSLAVKGLEQLPSLSPGEMVSQEGMPPFYRLRSVLATGAPGELDRVVDLRTGAEAVRVLLAQAGRPDRDRVLLECLPVIPAGLRDFKKLDERRLAWHDVNDLYRRVIHRSQRLRVLSRLPAPPAIIDHEKQRLQELVDALIDNAHAARPICNDQGRPLQCLGDLVEDLPADALS